MRIKAPIHDRFAPRGKGVLFLGVVPKVTNGSLVGQWGGADWALEATGNIIENREAKPSPDKVQEESVIDKFEPRDQEEHRRTRDAHVYDEWDVIAPEGVGTAVIGVHYRLRGRLGDRGVGCIARFRHGSDQ